MPRNGNGVYNLPLPDVEPDTIIYSSWANETLHDVAEALTISLTGDGQTVPTSNLPMGGFHHINVGDPTLRNQYATLGMVQDGRDKRLTNIVGVDNVSGLLVGGATSYSPGALVSFFAPATNMGPMTLNYNGIGAKSLTDADGLSLAAGDIQANDFIMALYTGTEFRLITAIKSSLAADLYNLSITGQQRPPSNIYPSLTIASGTSVNIPAGSAWIVPPGNDPSQSDEITWDAQTITMQFLSSSFTTTIVVDNTGVIQQIPGRAIGANFRSFAVLGVVEHINGVVNNVITRPSIFGDDGYRARDAVSLLANTVINGALVTPNSVSGLQLDVAQGTIFIPGGSANTVDSPNTFNVPPQQNIQFRPLAGQNTLTALTATLPVGSYDANGAGTVAALPNPGDATVHRLFYLYGQYVLAYGQQVYSSVENALSFIAWDRTKFKKSLYLADATLMAEIIAIRSATNLNLIAQGAVVCPGGLNFSIGSPGGIAEAPIDGFPYGRKNAAWSRVLESTAPAILNSASITGPAPKLDLVMTPYAAGTNAVTIWADAFKWFAIEVTNPDDKMYLRSYNPANGALRHTWTFDLATGGVKMDANSIMQGPAVSVVDHVPQFADASGGLLKDGLPVQTSTIDATANALLKQGAFGLGNGIQLANNVDLDTVVNSGFFRCGNTPVNGPAATTNTQAMLLVNRTGDYCIQYLMTSPPNDLATMVWYRFGNPASIGGAGAWGDWRPVMQNQLSAIATNLDTILLPGFYNVAAGATNQPIAGATGYLTVIRGPNGYTQQFTQSGTGNFERFERVNTLSTWFAWNRLATVAGAKYLSVVSSLPGSPDANTIYFVT